MDGTTWYTYPEDWGAKKCKKWLKNMPPDCAYENGTVKPDAPNYCDTKIFCIVGEECTLEKETYN